MKNKCKNYFNEKFYYRTLIFLLIVIIVILLFDVVGNQILKFISGIEIFNNEYGFYDWGVFWTCIGSVGSILGFIGVIITIKFSEESRKRQNKYDVEKERKLSNQQDFEIMIRDFLSDIDPINTIKVLMNRSEETYVETINSVDSYMIKLKSIYSKISWYYVNNTDEKLKKKQVFIDNYVIFIGEICQYLNAYRNDLSLYNTAKLYKNYDSLEKYNALTIIDKERFDELKQKYKSVDEIYNIITNGSFEEMKKLTECYNNKWNNIIEKAKEMIMERENYIKIELEVDNI